MLMNRVRGLEFRASCPTINQFMEIVKKANQVGVIEDTSYEHSINRAVKDEKLVRFKSFDDMLKAVTAGKLFASVQGETAARYYLHTNPFANIRLKLCEYEDLIDHVWIAVRPDAPDLVRWIDVLLEVHGMNFDAEVIVFQDPERILP